MRKNKLIMTLVFTFLFLSFGAKVHAAVDEQDYSIISVSKDDLLVKSVTIMGGSKGGNSFWADDPISFYSSFFLVYIGGELRWSIQAVWDDSNYIVKEGYQEVSLTLPYPAEATVVLGITGKAYQSPSPTPVIKDATNETESQEEEEVIDQISPSLSKSTVSVKPNVKYKLEIEDLPEGYTVSFVSSNKKIATVGLKGGVITGRIKGKTTIRCIILAPNGDKITLKCSVIVK